MSNLGIVYKNKLPLICREWQDQNFGKKTWKQWRKHKMDNFGPLTFRAPNRISHIHTNADVCVLRSHLQKLCIILSFVESGNSFSSVGNSFENIEKVSESGSNGFYYWIFALFVFTLEQHVSAYKICVHVIYFVHVVYVNTTKGRAIMMQQTVFCRLVLHSSARLRLPK